MTRDTRVRLCVAVECRTAGERVIRSAGDCCGSGWRSLISGSERGVGVTRISEICRCLQGLLVACGGESSLPNIEATC